MLEPEGERLEFKEAKSNYHFEKLAKYLCALSNEGGGTIILGVSDRRPRRVTSTAAFEEPGRTTAGLCERLRIRVTFQEVQHPDGRVLAFHAPRRPTGMPVQVEGIYWARSGDELRPLSAEELKRIFDEAGSDTSAEFHPLATLDDLDLGLIDRFHEMWMRKSGNEGLRALSAPQLLEDAELIDGERITQAALVLLGKNKALSRHLAQARSYSSIDRTTPRCLLSSGSSFAKDFWQFLTNSGIRSTCGTTYCIFSKDSFLWTFRC